MANEAAKTWIPIVVIAGVVVCLCFILGLFWCLWYVWDGGILREEPGPVEEPGAAEGPATVEEPERHGPPGVTLANFGRIKVGMPYREVVAIFGCEGTLKSITRTSPGRPDMRHYRWRDGKGGWAYVTFVDGLVYGADQYDLQ